MSIRKLASIQRILDIQPIPDADAIEVATINGWKVVIAKKDNFKVGDLVVYCEVDCWMPTALAPFLSKGQEPREYDGIKGERLRTVKLRGQLSQGLILSLGPTDRGGVGYGGDLREGIDLTELLGIVKYEPPVPAQLAGVALGSFPSQIPRTDEERIQNLTNEWEDLLKGRWEITEKFEGSSMTVGLLDDEFIVCSRNLKLKEVEGNTLWGLARKYDIENKMRVNGYLDLALQGEVIGEGIQGNHYGIKGQDFYVFAIYNVREGKYVNPQTRKTICDNLGLKHVPVIAHTANLYDTLGISTVADVLEFADGQSAFNAKVLREGIVFKEVDGQGRHWKAVSNKYLLKHGN